MALTAALLRTMASLRRLFLWLVVAASSTLTGCAGWMERVEPGLRLQVGQTEAEVLGFMGPPTGRYAMPAGATRLEYARGPYGRVTWMVDVDAGGTVVAFENALVERNFMKVVDGMTRDELLRLLGRPVHVAGESQNRVTWSWRYLTNDCLWFRVSVTEGGSERGRVWGGGGMHQADPICDW